MRDMNKQSQHIPSLYFQSHTETSSSLQCALEDTIELPVVSDNQIIKTNLSAIVSMMKYTNFVWETK